MILYSNGRETVNKPLPDQILPKTQYSQYHKYNNVYILPRTITHIKYSLSLNLLREHLKGLMMELIATLLRF